MDSYDTHWCQLCEEYNKVKKELSLLDQQITGFFSAIARNESSINPSEEQLSRRQELAASLNDIESRKQTFLREYLEKNN